MLLYPTKQEPFKGVLASISTRIEHSWYSF